MKTKHVILILGLLIFNSCIVKSLNPFYTKENIEFTEDLIGEWTDKNNDTWTIKSVKEVSGKQKSSTNKISEEEKNVLEEYKNSYLVEYKTKKQEKSFFIATPFKIGNQFFLDFIPVDAEKIDLTLLKYHVIYTHSLVKLDILNDDSISIKWFDEKRLKKLFKEKKIKIKHKKVGIMKDNVLLTATSEELEQFLKKYMVSSSTKKWETETKFTLTKS